jgi:hypothetical protein
LRVHSLRATAATNALSHDADIAKVQEWLGHANVSITRLYERRKSKPEDSPTFIKARHNVSREFRKFHESGLQHLRRCLERRRAIDLSRKPASYCVRPIKHRGRQRPE